MAMQMVMGNQAIALGAMQAGVNVVAGYPGTPSSEIIETVARYRERTGVYVEWSVNEKAAVELAAGASYAGSRTLVTMKQVGLNVASDPVMCLAYVGVKGGMVIVSADDPGPISSQTEQDTRSFAQYSKLPVFDPSSPEEAYRMVQDAFEFSEKYATPVLLRPTTRVCHAYESLDIPDFPPQRERGTFTKDPLRWVIFPKLSYQNHAAMVKRNGTVLPQELSSYGLNRVEPASCGTQSSLGIAAGGISYAYVKEALRLLADEHPESKELGSISLLKVSTPYPFPEPLAERFMASCRKILVVEELDPVIEREILFLAGKTKNEISVSGKLTGDIPCAGENTVPCIKDAISRFAGLEKSTSSAAEVRPADSLPELPVRPPVLCAGCPHRGSFYAVKRAMGKKKSVWCGDIGCYTLGNAKPLDMCDTCLCMGAGITMAQGFYHNESDTSCFAFIGDSTFFASGITGVVNAVYNRARLTVCVLDNSTTAMTGHQPHPGTGRTMMGDMTGKLSIPAILSALGVSPVIEANPFNLEESMAAVRTATESEGVSAIIFKAPCIAIAKDTGWQFPGAKSVHEDSCVGCKRCITELGCPAISLSSGKAGKPRIDASLCTGCSLCAQVCPADAIR